MCPPCEEKKSKCPNIGFEVWKLFVSILKHRKINNAEDNSFLCQMSCINELVNIKIICFCHKL